MEGGGGSLERLPRGCPEVSEDELLMMLKTYLFRLPGPSGKSGSSYTYSDCTTRSGKGGPGWKGCRLGVTDASPRRNQNTSVTQLDCPFAFNRVSDIVMLKSQKLMGRGID